MYASSPPVQTTSLCPSYMRWGKSGEEGWDPSLKEEDSRDQEWQLEEHEYLWPQLHKEGLPVMPDEGRLGST